MTAEEALSWFNTGFFGALMIWVTMFGMVALIRWARSIMGG